MCFTQAWATDWSLSQKKQQNPKTFLKINKILQIIYSPQMIYTTVAHLPCSKNYTRIIRTGEQGVTEYWRQVLSI